MIIAGAAALLGTASSRLASAQQPPRIEGMSRTITTNATVDKVNLKTRELTLTGPDGKRFTVSVPESVKRFDRVKPGDTVTTEYRESVVVEIRKPGEAVPPPSETRSTTRAPGALPAGTASRQVTAVVDVVSTDPATNHLTVKTSAGDTTTLEVTDPANQAALRSIKRGDQLQITYNEAMAVSVSPAAK
jgi:hypothetical protein